MNTGINTNEILEAFYSGNRKEISFEAPGKDGKAVIRLDYDISNEIQDRRNYVRDCMQLEQAQRAPRKPTAERVQEAQAALQQSPSGPR